MKLETKLIRTSDGWYFQVLSYQGEKIVNNLLIYHETLIEAINTANSLGIHIDNMDELPLSQYKRVG